MNTKIKYNEVSFINKEDYSEFILKAYELFLEIKSSNSIRNVKNMINISIRAEGIIYEIPSIILIDKKFFKINKMNIKVDFIENVTDLYLSCDIEEDIKLKRGVSMKNILKHC